MAFKAGIGKDRSNIAVVLNIRRKRRIFLPRANRQRRTNHPKANQPGTDEPIPLAHICYTQLHTSMLCLTPPGIEQDPLAINPRDGYRHQWIKPFKVSRY